MRLGLRRSFAIVFLSCLLLNADAQEGTRLSVHAADVRESVASLAPQSKISVEVKKGAPTSGLLVSAGDTEFRFYDVHTRREASLPYEAVRNVTAGYESYEQAARKEHNHEKRTIFIACGIVVGVIGLVVAVTVAVAHSSNASL